MNIYEKIQTVKENILTTNIKKSGQNKFANYTYYELSDFLPVIVQKCNEVKLFTQIIFKDTEALLNIIDAEKPDDKIEYTSPVQDLELKGCNKVQAMGGMQTYIRRYLYMNAFDIVENDMFDGNKPDDTKAEAKILKATVKQLEIINNLVEDKEAMLKYYKVDKLEDLTANQASEIIMIKGGTKNADKRSNNDIQE